MNHRLMRSLDYFDSKSPRERYLTLVVVLVGVISLFYTFVVEPQQARIEAIDVQNQQISAQTKTTEQELDAVSSQIRQFEMTSARLAENEQELQQRLVDLRQQVGAHQRGFVNPGQATEAIEQLFNRGSTLELVRFVNHTGVELFRSKIDGNVVYKHRFTLEFLASYQSVSEFLKVIERDQLPVHFESFHYRVERYPTARVTLVGFTLSSSGQYLRFGTESGN